MTLQPSTAWRIAAAALWIVSIVCLFRAIVGAVTAEQSLYIPHLTDPDRLSIHQQAQVADRWDAVGWVLQFTAAAVLSLGLKSPRIVRRIFASLGVLIAADGIGLLLTVCVIPH